MWKSGKDDSQGIGKGPVPGADGGTNLRTGMGAGMEMDAGGGGGLSLRNLKTFSSLKNPIFRRYYGSMLGQQAAFNMQMITRSLLIYRLSGSAAILGVMSLAGALPSIFLSIFGGVIADRVQKKHVLLVGLVGSAVVSLGVALALQLGYLSAESTASWWVLIVSSILHGSILALMMPSRQAIITEIVGEERLMNAVALNALGTSTFRLLAPAIAGLLIDGFGFEATYYVIAGLYLVAVVFIAPIPLTSTMRLGEKSALMSVKEAFQYLRRETTVLLVLLLSLVVIVLSMPTFILMPIFADDVLKVGATGMGILMGVAGGGAIVSSFVLASLPNKKRGAMLLISGLILALALAVFAFSHSWYLSLAMMVFAGASQTAVLTMSSTMLLYYTAHDYTGRVMSLYVMQFGLMSFGGFFAGLLAETAGVQWAVGGFAMVLALLSILALALLPRIRKLD